MEVTKELRELVRQREDKFHEILFNAAGELSEMYYKLIGAEEYEDERLEFKEKLFVALMGTATDFTRNDMDKSVEVKIRWKDDNRIEEHLMISLDGYDDDTVFFVCDSPEKFWELLEENNGEDFIIEDFEFC